MNIENTYPRTIPTRDLQLGDTVQASPELTWSFAIVKQIEHFGPNKTRFATLFRPYGTTAGFAAGKKVITYIGIDEYKIPMNGQSITLWQREKLR